mgnify:CR=1 FL=1|tara:strand:- start:2526 stop:4064 length:1539 start_codon:yes stop_codon:yes gene_type:complete
MQLDDFNICQFEGKIREIKEEEFEAFGLSEGSIAEAAQSLLPEDFDPEQNIDVLPVVFNLAKVNEFNKNGDGIDSKTALAAVKRFINKPINIEHKKDKIVGHMINASFSTREFDFKNNDIESYADKTEPYYINAAGLIYKQIYPKLADAIMEASDDNDESYQSISASWELAFKEYEVAYGSNILEDSKVLTGSEKEDKKQYLKGLGGKGEDDNGKPVNRLIVGETYPLGAALTRNPAAAVKGIYSDEPKEEKMESEKISLNSNKNVNADKFKFIFNNMDKEQFDELMAKVGESVASVVKQESEASTIGEIMRDALTDHSESWKSKVELEREAKAKAEADLSEVKETLDTTKEELETLKAEAEAKATADLFNDRMNFIDNDYDLNEQELELVTAEVKGLESTEEAFEAYKGKLQVIFAHKLKANIEAKEAEIKARIEEAVASKTEAQALAEESEAPQADPEPEPEPEPEEPAEELEVEEDEEADSSIPNNNADASEKISLVERLKKNFSVEVS